MIQIRSIVQKVTFGTFSATLGTFWAPSDPSGPNFHMREWWPMVLNHNRNRFRPFPAKSNDSNWIRSPKSMFLHFFSIFAKCQSQKGAKKNFEKFYCFFLLRMTQKFSIFFFFSKISKSPKVGTVLGPFGPKTQNTTHQSSITPLLHSFYHILSSYKKLLKTVKPFSRYSTLKNRAIWLDESVWPKKGVKGFFSEKSVSASFYPLLPPNFMQKIRKI